MAPTEPTYDANGNPDITRSEPWPPLTDEQATLMRRVKLDGNALFALLDMAPASREISLAKTNLEQALMWAVKGITTPAPTRE